MARYESKVFNTHRNEISRAASHGGTIPIDGAIVRVVYSGAMKQTNMYRQGDVMIVAVGETSAREFKRVGQHVVLAHGEATGHAHTIDAPRPMLRLDNPDGSFLLKIASNVEVKHQEHAPIALPKGTYRISRQREYAPEAIRNVAD